jgi:hypothetical protein
MEKEVAKVRYLLGKNYFEAQFLIIEGTKKIDSS